MCIALEIAAKTVICTNSLSVIPAILNSLSHNWHTVNQIGDMLISKADFLKILKNTPGHTYIPVNEKAQQAAKHIQNNQIKSWHEYQHSHYKSVTANNK